MKDEINEHEDCLAFEEYIDLPIYSEEDYSEISPDKRRFYEEESLECLWEWKIENLEKIDQCLNCQENLKETVSHLKELFYVEKRGERSRTKFTKKLMETFEYSPKDDRIRKIRLEEVWKDCEWKEKSGNSYFKLDWDSYTGSYNFYAKIRSSIDKKWWILIVIKEEINKQYSYKSILKKNNSERFVFSDFTQLGKGRSLED